MNEDMNLNPEEESNLIILNDDEINDFDNYILKCL